MSDPNIYSETWNYGGGEEPLDNPEGRHEGPFPGYHRPGPHYDYPDRLRPPEWPFGPASAPNWQPGYVPSATEWRSWFSRKYDTDDATLAGGPFIPLGGGQMLGPLILARQPRVPNEAATKRYVDNITPAAEHAFLNHGGDVNGDVSILGGLQVAGDIYADCDLQVKRDLKVGQTLYVQGYSMFTNNVDINADTTVSTTLYIGPIGAQGYQSACPPGDDEAALRQAMWGLYVDPTTGDRITSYTNGAYDVWRQASGQREWWAPGQSSALMTLDIQGNLTLFGHVSSAGQAGSGGNTVINNGLVVNPAPGQLDAAVFKGGVEVDGDLAILGVMRTAPGNVGGLSTVDSLTIQATPGQLDALVVYGDCQLNSDIVAVTGVVNATAFNVVSDARLKRDIEPAGANLELVRALRPKTFARTSDPRIRELGLLAQDVQEVIPQAVSGDKTLSISMMPLLTVLIGAVQELDRKVEALAK